MTFDLNKLLGNAQIPMMCTEEVIWPEKHLEIGRFHLLVTVCCNETGPKEEWCFVHQDLAYRHAQSAWESRDWFANCQFWTAQ